MSLLHKLTDLPDNHRDQMSDMERRYHGTFLIKTDNNLVLQYAGADRTQLHFNDPQTGKTLIVDGHQEHPIEPFLPKIGYYNIKGVPYYLVKIPQRQWKRSFCSAIYAILDNDGNNTYSRSFSSAAVPFLAKPEYASLDQISSSLFANIAVSRNFAILKTNDNVATLVFRKYKIGILDFESRTVLVSQASLMQEVLDLFKSTRIITWKLRQTNTE